MAYSNKLVGLYRQAKTIHNQKTIFDLSRTEFLTPFGIILLAGTIEGCLTQDKQCTLLPPKKPAATRFLTEIGFRKFFGIKNGTQKIKIESRNVQLKQLSHVDYSLTEHILQVFQHSLHMSEGVSSFLKMALNELMTNAFDHSGSQAGCYVCAQSYPVKKRIRLCIADFGIGILASLKKMAEHKDLNRDEEAIALAVQEGITSRKDRFGGYGLSHINRFVEANGGEIKILSGSGKVAWNYAETNKEEWRRMKPVSSPFEGTAIDLLIHARKEEFYFLKSEKEDLFPRGLG